MRHGGAPPQATGRAAAKRRGRAAPLVAVSLACLSGCAGVSTTVPTGLVPRSSLRHAEPAEVREAFDAYCLGIQTLSASGDLTVSDLSSGQNRRMAIRMVARREGRLYLKGSVAVVTVLEVVSDGERFWFRLPSKKKIWTGPNLQEHRAAAGETGDEAYRALRPSDVTRFLLPEPLAPGPGDALAFEADARSFVLTQVAAGDGVARVRRRVWLFRSTLEVSRLAEYDEDGQIEAEARLSQWEDGVPRRVTILRPLDGYQAAFALGDVKLNVPVPDQAFVPRLPDNHEVIDVE